MAVEHAKAVEPEAVGKGPAQALRRLLRLEPRLVAIGLVGGVLSGLLGVGGGVIMVPLLVLWAGYEQRAAHAASLGAIIPISIAGILTFGSIVGAGVGAGMLARLEERPLKLVFGSFLVAVATLMVVRR